MYMNVNTAIKWLEVAFAYNEASKDIKEDTLFPIMTLQAFSIECSLKALLVSQNKNIKHSHKFLILFNSLNTETQEDIKKQFLDKTELNITECFEKINNDFIESRYFFTDFTTSNHASKPFYTEYLTLISDFLIEYIKNHQ